MVVVAARESETRKSAPQVVDLMLRARALELQPQSMENFRENERLYREVLSLEPNNLNAMARLAATLAIHAVWIDSSDPRREKQMADARDLALKVKSLDPSVRGIETPLQIYAMEHNDFEGAKRAHKAHLAKDPKNPYAYNNLGSSIKNWASLIVLSRYSCRRCPYIPRAATSSSTTLATRIWRWAITTPLSSGCSRQPMGIRSSWNHWGLAMAYSNKGDRLNASRYVAEYQKRATEQGFKGIQSIAPPPESPPAYLKHYYEHFLPEWKKAGLP